VHGQIDLEQVEFSGFRTDKLGLRADIANQRQLAAHADAQQIRGIAGGGEIALESVVFDVSREPGAAGDPVTSRTAIQNLRFSSTGTEASLEELSAQIAGLMRPDLFQGTAFAAPATVCVRCASRSILRLRCVADQPFQLDQADVALQPRILGRIEASVGLQPQASCGGLASRRTESAPLADGNEACRPP
jgi:hypothetical protein